MAASTVPGNACLASAVHGVPGIARAGDAARARTHTAGTPVRAASSRHAAGTHGTARIGQASCRDKRAAATGRTVHRATGGLGTTGVGLASDYEACRASGSAHATQDLGCAGAGNAPSRRFRSSGADCATRGRRPSRRLRATAAGCATHGHGPSRGS